MGSPPPCQPTAVVVRQLPEAVRDWVVKTVKCDVNKRLCFACVRKTAPMIGFPRKGKTTARNKRGLCAFNGFTCEFERSELLPLPHSHKGFFVKRLLLNRKRLRRLEFHGMHLSSAFAGNTECSYTMRSCRSPRKPPSILPPRRSACGALDPGCYRAGLLQS